MGLSEIFTEPGTCLFEAKCLFLLYCSITSLLVTRAVIEDNMYMCHRMHFINYKKLSHLCDTIVCILYRFFKLIYSFQPFTNREGSSVDSIKERAVLYVKVSLLTIAHDFVTLLFHICRRVVRNGISQFMPFLYHKRV